MIRPVAWRRLLMLFSSARTLPRRSASTRKQLAFECLEERVVPTAGDLDLSFSGDGKQFFSFPNSNSSSMSAVALDDQGRSIVAGHADLFGVNDKFAVARLLSSGALDTTFSSDGMATVDFDLGGDLSDVATCVAIDSSGRIVVAGRTNHGTNGYDFAVARLLSDGTLDTTFDSDGRTFIDFGLGGGDEVTSLVIDGSDRIVLAGHAKDSTLSSDFAIARLLSDGTLDASFGFGGATTVAFNRGDALNDAATSVALDSSGRIVLAGYAQIGTTDFDFAIARLLSDGTPDAAFGFGGDGTTTVAFDLSVGKNDLAGAVTIDSAGRILLAGSAETDASDYDFAVARLLSDGTPDFGFDGDGKATTDFIGAFDVATAVKVDAQGRIVVAGTAGMATGSAFPWAFGLVRYTTTGALDTTFNGDGRTTTLMSNGDAGGEALALQADGKLVVVGDDDSLGLVAIARYHGGGLISLNASASSFPENRAPGLTVATLTAGAPTGAVTFGLVAGSGSSDNFRFSVVGNQLRTAVNFNYEARVAYSIRLRATDAGGNVYERAYTMTLTNVNDAPILTNPSSARVNRDGFVALPVSLTDADGGAGLFQARVSNSQGTLRLGSTAGLTFITGVNGSATFTVRGTLAALNAALATLTYQSGATYQGRDTFFVSVSDLGNTGPGGALADTATLPITGDRLYRVVGDFNADGRDDVATFNSTDGTWRSRLSLGTRLGSEVRWAQFVTPTGWTKFIAADFTGDRREDVAIFHAATGKWWVLISNGGSSYTPYWKTWYSFGTASGHTAQLAGDFNDDGKMDLADYHAPTGKWWVLRSNGAAFVGAAWATFSGSYTGQVAGDFTGDGKDDVASFHPGTGRWLVSRSTGSGFATTVWADFASGAGWSNQAAGDFNGDGRADIAQYHASSGSWYVSRSAGTAFSTSRWGLITPASGWSEQFVGDFNGDGRADLANLLGSTAAWWVSRSTASALSTTRWGQLPATTFFANHQAADLNGDGRDDVISYRVSDGSWWVGRSSGSAFTTTRW